MKRAYPFVSVVVVNYNGKDLLKDCFDSLLASNYPKKKIEIIMVDNCSQDDSAKYAKENYPEVKIIENDINNYCKANNLGISSSKGKYVMLLNNDTKVDKNWLAELVKVIEKDEKIGAVGSKILYPDGRIQNTGHFELPNFYWGERGAFHESKEFNKIEEVVSLCNAAVLYRKKCFDEVGLLDEDYVIYVEDVDIIYRIRQRGWIALLVPKSIVYHKFHGTLNHDISRFYIERNRLLFIAKFHPEKLSSSLMGNKYFTVENNLKYCGMIYSFLLDIIIKLLKHHKIGLIKDVLKDIFDELKRISNFENEVLKLKVQEANDQLSNLNLVSAQKQEELSSKANQLLQREQENNSLKDQLNALNLQLTQKQEELSSKANQLLQREQEKSSLKEELSGIYNSEGFRYVLHPLWMFIRDMRNLLKLFKHKVIQFIWLIITVSLFPLFLFLVVSFLIENTIWFIFRRALNKFVPKRGTIPFKVLKVSLVIPNWNGVNYLKECLPSVFAAEDFKDGKNEVLVVDDASTDGSVDYIRSNFPQVRLILNKKNKGFGFTCNRGIKEAKNELIVLINNDIIVTENFLGPLIIHFRDEDVFAVTPKLYGWDRKTFAWGMHMGHFKDGYIRLWNEVHTGSGDRIFQSSPSIFAIGGAMVFRKRDFLWLGGFDEIYRPNCWEDIDISYRAWKRGLKVIYEPSSLMYHKGKATLTYERYKEIKNEISFTWKNITDGDILRKHLWMLPSHLYKERFVFLRGLLWAFVNLPKILSHRFKERRFIQLKDHRIFNAIMLYYRDFSGGSFKHRQNDKPSGEVYKDPLPDNEGSEDLTPPIIEKVLDRTKDMIERKIEHLNGMMRPDEGPEELHIELTYRCDSKCIMCNLWDYQKRFPKSVDSELSLDEIRRFVEESRYLRKAKVVVLSGGEPFLRRDIVDICGFFSKYLPNSSIGMLTNAMNTDHIIIKTKEILDSCRPKSLWIGSSLDGLDKQHDMIRGIDGAFLAFQKTIERFKKELPEVGLSATFTLTPYNIDQLIPAYEFAKNEGLNFFAQFVVPKEGREKFIWTESDLHSIEDKVRQIIKEMVGHRDYQSFISSIGEGRDNWLVSQLYYWSHLVRYQSNPQRFFKKCIAGSRFAMFNPYGDLYFCPILKEKIIGNVREDKFDQLWMSERAQELRDFIKDGNCNCWLVCIVFPLLDKVLNNR